MQTSFNKFEFKVNVKTLHLTDKIQISHIAVVHNHNILLTISYLLNLCDLMNLYVNPPGEANAVSVWDLVAPNAIVKEKGGKMTNWYGEMIDYKSLMTINTRHYQGMIVAPDEETHNLGLEAIVKTM